MQSYEEIKELYPFPEEVKPIKKYRSYKNGTCTIFDTLSEASKFSKLNEMFIENAEEYNEWKKETASWQKQVNDTWERWLRQEYSYLDDKVYNLCYDMAYYRGHSAGYDEVANYMIDIVDFADNIIKAIHND